MKNIRLVNIILILMLIINVAFLGSWWYGHWKAHHMMRGKHERFAGHEASKGGIFLVNALGFTDAQQKQLENLRKEHFSKVKTMEAAIDRNEKNLMGALMANPADSVKAMICADSVGMLKAGIQKELFNHFNSVKKMCTTQQSAKFDTLVEEMSKEFPHHWDTYHSKAMRHDSL